jgi:hypothetical protein
MAGDHPQWRTRNGRFAAAWQPRFRPDRPRARFELVPIDVWRAILMEANEPVVVAMEGRRRQLVTRLEAALLELGCNPAANSARIRTFISAVKAAAYHVELADALERKATLDRAATRDMRKALRRNDDDLWQHLIRQYGVRVTEDEPHDEKLLLAAHVYEDGVPAADRAGS